MSMPAKFGVFGFFLGILVALIMAWVSSLSGNVPTALLFSLWPASIFGFGFNPGPDTSVFSYIFVYVFVLGGNGIIYALPAFALGNFANRFRKKDDVSLSLKR